MAGATAGGAKTVPAGFLEGPVEAGAMSQGAGSDVGGDSTAVNALIGAVASVVLFFLPFQTVVGGVVAGYLQGPDTDDGLWVGALAGVFMLVPLLLVLLLFGGAVLAVLPFLSGEAFGLGALGFVAFLVVLVVGGLYTVGLAALGGVLGAWVNREL